MRAITIAAIAIAFVGCCNAASSEVWAYCHAERARCTPRGAGACDDPQFLPNTARFFVPAFVTQDTSGAREDEAARDKLLTLVIQRTGLRNNWRETPREYWVAHCPKGQRVLIEGWANQLRWGQGYTEVRPAELGY